MLDDLLAQPLRGLLFDLDGTLLDSAPDIAKGLDGALAELGLPLAGEAKTRQWIGNGAKVLVARALADIRQCDEAAVGPVELERAFECFLNHYGQVSAQFSTLYKGVLPALKHWQQQGIKMAVVTNKPEQFVGPLLARFGLDGFFQCVVGGDTLKDKKPAPEPLLFACRQMKLTVEHCIMIGDSRNDVEAARAANMPIACVSYGYNHGEPVANTHPDVLVDSLEALI